LIISIALIQQLKILFNISVLPEKRFIPFAFSEDEIKILLKTIYDQIKKTESTFLTDLSI